jgi:iron complex transport system permease protein
MDPADTATAHEGARARRTLRLTAWLLGCLVLLLLAVPASLAIGSQPIAPGTVLHDLVRNDGSDDALIIRGLRLPRTALGLAAGAALGLAGALMQAVTRNPLADPGLLGVNAGASAAAVVAIAVLHLTSQGADTWFALAGPSTSARVATRRS